MSLVTRIKDTSAGEDIKARIPLVWRASCLALRTEVRCSPNPGTIPLYAACEILFSCASLDDVIDAVSFYSAKMGVPQEASFEVKNLEDGSKETFLTRPQWIVQSILDF